jgi:hypothetical protein
MKARQAMTLAPSVPDGVPTSHHQSPVKRFPAIRIGLQVTLRLDDKVWPVHNQQSVVSHDSRPVKRLAGGRGQVFLT